MRWVDCCGAPGSGKSTLCDALYDNHAIGWDELPPPAKWRPFFGEITRLFHVIRGHPSFVAAVRMNRRSMRKMSTVHHINSDDVYIQTGFVQRGLGFGWRIHQMGGDLNEIRPFFEMMPVSVGVAVASAPLDVIIERNKLRETVKATAHENRSFQVPHMLAALPVALDVLKARGVPILEIDTTQPIEEARSQLVKFSQRTPHDCAPGGVDDKLTMQPWW